MLRHAYAQLADSSDQFVSGHIPLQINKPGSLKTRLQCLSLLIVEVVREHHDIKIVLTHSHCISKRRGGSLVAPHLPHCAAKLSQPHIFRHEQQPVLQRPAHFLRFSHVVTSHTALVLFLKLRRPCSLCPAVAPGTPFLLPTKRPDPTLRLPFLRSVSRPTAPVPFPHLL